MLPFYWFLQWKTRCALLYRSFRNGNFHFFSSDTCILRYNLLCFAFISWRTTSTHGIPKCCRSEQKQVQSYRQHIKTIHRYVQNPIDRNGCNLWCYIAIAHGTVTFQWIGNFIRIERLEMIFYCRVHLIEKNDLRHSWGNSLHQILNIRIMSLPSFSLSLILTSWLAKSMIKCSSNRKNKYGNMHWPMIGKQHDDGNCAVSILTGDITSVWIFPWFDACKKREHRLNDR